MMQTPLANASCFIPGAASVKPESA